MDTEIEVSREGRLGVIALNRPRAINALTHGMVRVIAETLGAWADDAEISAVLFEGRGERGFCSGGDVRKVRDLVLAGEAGAAHQFFADEYAMNGMISNYPKPTIALTDGIVMGGGLGISAHTRFRIASERARFAMPETAIGFFCDIGINAVLTGAPEHRALAFEMCGLAVGAADGFALGLTDCVVSLGKFAGIREKVVAACNGPDVEKALDALLYREGMDPGVPVFCLGADHLQPCFMFNNAADIVGAITAKAEGDLAVAEMLKVLRTRCPTSLETNLQNHRLARRHGGQIGKVLAADLALAWWMCERADFAEGVRSVLVDKDNAPRWAPAHLIEVDAEAIAAILANI